MFFECIDFGTKSVLLHPLYLPRDRRAATLAALVLVQYDYIGETQIIGPTPDKQRLHGELAAQLSRSAIVWPDPEYLGEVLFHKRHGFNYPTSIV